MARIHGELMFSSQMLLICTSLLERTQFESQPLPSEIHGRQVVLKLIGFEAVTPVTVKSSIFRDCTQKTKLFSTETYFLEIFLFPLLHSNPFCIFQTL
jgi:hypothetical protein